MRARALPSPALQPMTVAGMMSGTSADGIDIAFVRIAEGEFGPKLKLLGHHAVPFSRPLCSAILKAMDAKGISTAELARLNWRLGIAYNDALSHALEAQPLKIHLVGCHGQTIYHQGVPSLYAGRQMACTWQIGEMGMLAAHTGVPVVSNFRPADMVAGGQGAPLVSLLDFVHFRHATRGRVLQNLGGIANLTAIPPGGSTTDVVAFDSGPANMVMDALMQILFQKPHDRGGRTAARGRVIPEVLAWAAGNSYFRQKPPKSAGREEFGAGYAANFLKRCQSLSKRPEDAITTAAALTVESIRSSYERFVRPMMGDADVDYIVSGGGAENSTLMAMLDRELTSLGCSIKRSDNLGLPAQAKEAAAFALLAYQTWHRRPGNVPAATGALAPAILGSITYA